MRKTFRKATVREWILLGKLLTRGVRCHVCHKPLTGMQLVYSNARTRRTIAVCSSCVGTFEKQTNPMPVYCKGCKYNLPKMRGGFGKICNGWAQKKYGRCPEWVLNEAREANVPVRTWTHKIENPTLTIPIKSKKQLGHLFKAQSQLSKAGVSFDTGTSFKDRRPHARDWELDWSLRGAHIRNPIRHTKEGWFWGSVGPQPTRSKLLAQIRAIYAGGYKGRNPNHLRPRRYIVDGRLRLKVGDRVKIIKKAREEILKNTGIEIKPRDLWTVKTIQYDIAVRKFGVVIESGSTKLYIYASDLIYHSESKNPVGLYQAFHGNPPKGTKRVFYTPPDGPLLKIGRLASLEYIPEPPSKHTGTRFAHEAGDLGHKVIKSNAILATNKAGTQLFLVREKKNIKTPYFSRRGIVG